MLTIFQLTYTIRKYLRTVFILAGLRRYIKLCLFLKTMDNNCKPTKKEKENKYHSADFNCNGCNQTDCIYWLIYNGYIEEKTLKEDINNFDV